MASSIKRCVTFDSIVTLHNYTNTTPDERLFNYNRRSCLGACTPTWLNVPGNVLLKRHVRTNISDPLVDEV